MGKKEDETTAPVGAPPVGAPPVGAPPVEAPPVEIAPAEIAPQPQPPKTIAALPEIARDATGQPLITNSFTDTDIRQALGDIAVQSGQTVVADNTIQGTITVDLNNVPFERALTILLRSGGFSWIKLDDYYLAGLGEPSNPNFPLLSRTEIVRLKYVRPESVIDFLSLPYGRFLSAPGNQEINRAATRTNDDSGFRRSLSSGFSGNNSNSTNRSTSSPAVGAPPDNYTLSITAPEYLLERIKADIARLDKPVPQIMLEAYVLEISQNASKNFNFGFSTKYFSFNTNGGNNGGNSLSYSSVANSQLAQINALTASGAARLRANPRVTTSDGQTAEIEVGSENYFQILSGNLTFQYNTLEVIRSGILLRITPRVLQEENEVVALVEPEVRDVTGQGPNGLPVITFRRAATNIRVRDGQSIVIAGLVNEFTAKSKTKIPILGDIPLLGKIFRGENSQDIRTETVIIITPRIIRDDQPEDQVQSLILNDELARVRTDKPLENISPKLPPLDGKSLEKKK